MYIYMYSTVTYMYFKPKVYEQLTSSPDTTYTHIHVHIHTPGLFVLLRVLIGRFGGTPGES